MPKRRTRRSPSAIDLRRRELEREQADLQRRMSRLHAVLLDAPERIARLRQEQQEEELARRHGRRTDPHRVFGIPCENPRQEKGRRTLRRERRAQWMQFLVLLATLSVLLWFLFLKLP